MGDETDDEAPHSDVAQIDLQISHVPSEDTASTPNLKERGGASWLNVTQSVQSLRDTVSSRTKSALNYVQSIWDGKLFKFVDLPEWMKDNEYITDMHRPQITSLKSCLKSVFSIHAETGNIWTHLIGALVFLGLIIWYLVRDNGDFIKPLEEKAVVVTFYSSAFLCLRFIILYIFWILNLFQFFNPLPHTGL